MIQWNRIKEIKALIEDQKHLADEAAASGSGDGVPPAVMQTFKLTAESKMEGVAESERGCSLMGYL